MWVRFPTLLLVRTIEQRSFHRWFQWVFYHAASFWLGLFFLSTLKCVVFSRYFAMNSERLDATNLSIRRGIDRTRKEPGEGTLESVLPFLFSFRFRRVFFSFFLSD